ncbi:Barwin-related endoglucanase protein [Rutstroemia sp. NJR-2017a BVV2]|nr:Barwin-related endoglucanase protein [Rutstroemia sp. NJR-2017a BVV2]
MRPLIPITFTIPNQISRIKISKTANMVFSIKSLTTATTIFSLAQGAVLGKYALTGKPTTYRGNTTGEAYSFSIYTLLSSIFGTIIDKYPSCGPNHLDLYLIAFTSLAALSEGIIDIIDCPITTPLELYNKEGISANWFSIQVVNAVEGVTSLEVSTDSGATWGSTTRQIYNFFEYAAGYRATIDVKVTGISGSTVVVKDVAVTPGSVVTASGNLGSGSGSATSATTSAATSAVVATSSAEATKSSVAANVEPSTTAVQATSASTEVPIVVPTTSSSPSAVVATSTAAPVVTSAASSAPKPTQSIVYVYEDGDEYDA